MESIALDGRLLMMGLVQALFEGSMMTWIVLWVPAIQNAPEVCFTCYCLPYFMQSIYTQRTDLIPTINTLSIYFRADLSLI